MRISMFPWLLSALLVSAFPLSALPLTGCGPASARPAAGPADTTSEAVQPIQLNEALPPKIFRDGTGIEVSVVFLAPVAGQPNHALIRFTGADLPMAGKVVLAKAEGSPEHIMWKVPYDGRQKTLLSTGLRERGDSARMIVKLYMPRTRDAVKLSFHEQATLGFDIDTFIAAHHRHMGDGSLTALAKIDRPFHEQEISRWLDIASERNAKRCGQKIPYEVDWASIGDEQMLNTTRCRTAYAATREVCKRDPLARETLLETVKNVRCSHAAKNALAVDAHGTLHLQTNYEVPMTDKDAYEALVSSLKLGQVVLADERDRILIFDPDSVSSNGSRYFGDHKILFKLRLEPLSHRLWDPHGVGLYSYLKRNNKGWQIRCRKRILQFSPVPAERRDRILRTAAFKEERWKREEFALARDNRGNYYYVDRYTAENGGKNYRVFRGPRGNLKETKLIDIVDDSDGMIFATKRGKLRLLLGNKREYKAQWIDGKKPYDLVVLPLAKNIELIYTGLGVYDVERMRTLCE